jgi:hypothetical protein
MTRPYEPELRSIPLTFMDCDFRMPFLSDGTGNTIGNARCRFRGFKYFPKECEVECTKGQCPRGYP